MAMDLTTAATESDTETPPTSQPRKTHSHHAPLPTVEVVAYKECLKNHAASIGGHALDGCCEFMLGLMANPSDPTSLKCGACGCHRNFHRRDPDDPAPLATAGARRTNSASQLLLSLSQQSPSGPSDEIDPRVVGYLNGHRQRSKKRFRTKFRQEQKEKMQEFAERIGWRLRRGEERLVEEFCKSIGVGRGIFKVWMHNNKSSNSRREKQDVHQDVHLLHHSSSSNGNGNGNGNGNCAAVVYHQFYANGGAQEAQ